MTRFALTALTGVWALAIPAFWWNWLRTPVDAATKPAGYETHERSFVLPDSVLALLLAACAVTTAAADAGALIGLVAGGMMLFLGLIDISYDLQNDAEPIDFVIDAAITASAVVILVLSWLGAS